MSDCKKGTNVAFVRIKPQHYVHVLDTNTNVTKIMVGPQTYVRQAHETVAGPMPMVHLPPQHFCRVEHPVVMDADKPAMYDWGQVRVRHGDEEYRTAHEFPDPFPLYPGEVLSQSPQPLPVIKQDEGLRLRALRDVVIAGQERRAREEWLLLGPTTYVPVKEVETVEVVQATVIKPNYALRLRAKLPMVDAVHKQQRIPGEEWLVRKAGAYLPGAAEIVVGQVEAKVLTDKLALHLKATRDFEDVYKVNRRAGEEWLVTLDMAETHVPDVAEEVITVAKATSLTNRQYCFVANPVQAGVHRYGELLLRKGECTFFLQPGESLSNGIESIHVLREDESLLLAATRSFKDEGGVDRTAGERWLVNGPREYVPNVEVSIVERRQAIALADNQGVYVRDLRTGQVTLRHGETFMLQAHEVKHAKLLRPDVEALLQSRFGITRDDKTAAVTVRAQHNTAVQIINHANQSSRVVFGPDLVMLEPSEEFTLLSISGGKPKRPNQIKDLALQLGPEFSSDVLTVETKDHARLRVRMSYNWHFNVDPTSAASATQVFAVRDFVGDFCKDIASRVRRVVAQCEFDKFHKASARIIHEGVFGDEEQLTYSANNLVVTSVDVQGVEPEDVKTNESLQKSVQLAIEITTRAQEASARHEAERLEQNAKGELKQQQIKDEAAAEKKRIHLVTMQAESRAVEVCGQAGAEAKAMADARQIAAQSELDQARLRTQADMIQFEAEQETLLARQEAERVHQDAVYKMEISKCKRMAEIETKKLRKAVEHIGVQTIAKIAAAGPEAQKKMLQSLGVKGYMVTDSANPINLFSNASGFQMGGASGAPATIPNQA